MGQTFKFDLGAKARDKITGIEGTITGRTDFITGCRQYLLERGKDGEVKTSWFDEDRIIPLPEEPVAHTPQTGGGPMPTPSSSSKAPAR